MPRSTSRAGCGVARGVIKSKLVLVVIANCVERPTWLKAECFKKSVNASGALSAELTTSLSVCRVPYLAVARTFEKIEEDSGR